MIAQQTSEAVVILCGLVETATWYLNHLEQVDLQLSRALIRSLN
jgi:hypothetical protein